MRGFEIVGLFCVPECTMGISRSWMCSRIADLFSKLSIIYHSSMDISVRSVWFNGDFTIKTIVGFKCRESVEEASYVEAFLFISYIHLICRMRQHWCAVGIQTIPIVYSRISHWKSAFASLYSASPPNASCPTVVAYAAPVGPARLIPMWSNH